VHIHYWQPYLLVLYGSLLCVLAGAGVVFITVRRVCRIEKEKSQAKAEADDLRGQLDHLSKGKVRAKKFHTATVSVFVMAN